MTEVDITQIHKPEYDSEASFENNQSKEALFRELNQVVADTELFRFTLEAQGFPLAFTRSMGIYLWMLAVERGEMLPLAQSYAGQQPEVINDFFQDVDFLVYARTQEDFDKIDEILNAMVAEGRIRVTDPNITDQIEHPRKLSSHYWREIEILNDGVVVRKVDLFANIGIKEAGHRVIQSLDYNASGRLELYGEDEKGERVSWGTGSIRTAEINGSIVSYVAGEGAKEIYDKEIENNPRPKPFEVKPLGLILKQRILQSLLGESFT